LAIITILFSVLWLVIVTIYTVALAILLTSQPRIKADREQEYAPTVSLVVPTYNEGRIIASKLENILQFDYPRDKLNVLVVDSASTDDTRETVRRYAKENQGRMSITLIEQLSRQGKSSAINEALHNSTAEVFALTDVDVFVQPQALKRLVKNLAEQNIGAASGVEVPIGANNSLFQIEAGYRVVYTAVRMAEANLDTPFMCESEFSAFARDSLEPLKPGCMCDDLELTVMMRSRNRRGVYALDAPFFEREATSLKPKLLHKYRRGMANQHGLIRNRRVMFNKTLGRYGTRIFPFEFFVHVISPLLLVTAFALFIGTIFVSPSEAPVEAIVVAISGIPSLLLLRQLSRKYTNMEISNTQRTLSWLVGALAFIGFQTILAASLVRLGLRGPKLQWSQIEGTRAPIQGEIKVEST
jgi:cellulose synthase/poly-beta-1,6-N-acetylglucosamine synthase-like glycosyltransferase